MRRTVFASLMLCLLIFSACGNRQASPAVPGETVPAEPTVAKESRRTLVVCFSATGHTRPLAQAAAQYLDADFYEITPKDPYGQEDLDYTDPNSRTSIEQNEPSSRPELATDDIDTAQYDTVILAHPIWWGKAPRILFTFLEYHDFSGKTLVSMCTSASSPLGSSAEELRSALPDSVRWLESRRFSISAEKTEIEQWLNEIGLKEG